MPAQEVPRTDAPGPEDFADPRVREPFTAAQPALDMKTLSEASGGDLQGLLAPLADAYEAWIAAAGGADRRTAGASRIAR